MDAWIDTTWTAVLMVALSTLGIYASVVLLTRISGLRSFSKMSSFDFAMTVAIGSVIASTIVAETPPLLQAAAALAALYGLQMITAIGRQYVPFVRKVVNNDPVLLMVGRQVIKKNLRRARITEGDLRGKLRESNVIDYGQIRAVIMEATGDVSVLHAAPDGPDLEPDLFEGVLDSRLLFQKNSLAEEETEELKAL